jgi:hypothetical protein
MTDLSSSFNDVPGLLEERRRYEGWLAALEQRRDSTPAHVFERVQADYRGRLHRVSEQLAAHRQSIEEECKSLQSRISLLDAEDQLRRDERAELELRVHVGELASEDAETAFRAVDDVIGQLENEKGGLTQRVQELDDLLTERETPPPVNSHRDGGGGAVIAAAAPVESVSTSDWPPLTREPERAATPPDPEPMESAVEDEPDVEPTPASRHHEEPIASPRVAAGGLFDELAYLTQVGEKPAPAIAREDSPSETLVHSLNAPRGVREAPVTANMPSSAPVAVRTSGGSEQSKTLKCGECGAMNYPTEWYCERCGAELAAL